MLSDSQRYSRIASHSNALPLAIIRKFLLSFYVKRSDPSAMLSIILKEALLNWSQVTLSALPRLKILFEFRQKDLAFE